ncbi:MAG: tetratricopeptide repeat protein [Planctomycetaceae bacterium]
MASLDAADKLCEEARAAFKKRDMVQAQELFEQAISADSRHIAAHEGLAFLCFFTRDLERAAELFLRVSRLDPRRAEPLINLGAVHNRQEDFASAVRVLRQALTKDRRSADAYYNLGLAYRGQKQYGMGVSAYKEAIRLRPDMVEAHCNLGNALVEMGNHSQAIRAFERALEIDPNFKKAKGGLERARLKTDEAKRAISPFGRLVDMEKIAENEAQMDQKYRDMTPKERFMDRDLVHRLSKEAEQLGVGFLSQVREELEVALLSISRIVSENRDTHEWHKEAGELETAVERFHHVQQVLFQKANEIKDHEDSLKES